MDNFTQDHENSIEKLAKLAEGIQFCMLTTHTGEEKTLRSRPMTLQEAEFDGDFWFFTSKNAAVVSDLAAQPTVNLSFMNPKKAAYISVSGYADVVDDRAKAEELWNAGVKAWFPKGLDDPELTLIRVRVEQADVWETTSPKVVQLYGFAKAVLTGTRPGPEVGTHSHLDVVDIESRAG